ncbi:hypothetical protein F5Y16DRAFT_311413 [Xylariaceae sp. FL0255]|nr:hypothetical protein F5Y16DRAFT_311413 [Xylariaceae sp. FL0255]
MKIAVQLPARCHDETGTYSSADVVVGMLSLDVCRRQSISELNVTIKCSFEPHKEAASEFQHIPTPLHMFETSKVLFPVSPLSTSRRYTFAPGRYEYSFGLDFSLLARCMDARLACLPTSSRRNGRALFEIEATAKGCGILRRCARSRIYIRSVTIDPPNIPAAVSSGRCQSPSQAYQVVSCRTLGLLETHSKDVELDDSERQPRNKRQHEFLPAYSPVVVLGAIVGREDDGKTSLYPGGPLPLSIWVTMPRSCSAETAEVWLRSIHISLIEPKIIMSGGGRGRAYLADVLIRHVRLKMPLQTKSQTGGVVEIDSSLLRGCTIPPTAIDRPQQKLLLRVLWELSASTLPSNVFASVLIPVTIGDITHVPPEYAAVSHSSNQIVSE